MTNVINISLFNASGLDFDRIYRNSHGIGIYVPVEVEEEEDPVPHFAGILLFQKKSEEGRKLHFTISSLNKHIPKQNIIYSAARHFTKLSPGCTTLVDSH